MQTFRKLPTASPKNAENIVNNRWPSSILSTACHGSEIKILEPFLVFRFVVFVQQHVFVGVFTVRDCVDIALLETENTFEAFGFRRLAFALQAEQRPEEGYVGVDMTAAREIEKIGVALTDLRPSGKVIINEEVYDAMTEQGEYIQKGSTIKVVKYQAGQLYVLEEKGKITH